MLLLPPEVVLAVLGHFPDPLDLLRAGATCRLLHDLTRDDQLWGVVLRRSRHERAARWYSLVFHPRGILNARLQGGSPDERHGSVSTVAWLTFLARQKHALVACLRCGEPELTATTALAEVLMGDTFTREWLTGLPKMFTGEVRAAVLALPPQFVLHFVIARLWAATPEELERRVHLAECDLGEMRMQLALQWMQEKLSRTLIEKFSPLLALDEPMASPLRAGDTEPADLQHSATLLQASGLVVEALSTLELPLECRLLLRFYSACVRSQPAQLDRAKVEEAREEEQARLLAVGDLLGRFVAFSAEGGMATTLRAQVDALHPLPVESTGYTRERFAALLRRQRNQTLVADTLCFLLHHRNSSTDLLAEGATVQPWLQANQSRVDQFLLRASTVEDAEMEAYVHATVMNEQAGAEEQEEPVMRAGDSIAHVIRRRMQAYMHDLSSLSDRPTLNPTWPAWVLKRLYYLCGSLSLVIKAAPLPELDEVGPIGYGELHIKRGDHQFQSRSFLPYNTQPSRPLEWRVQVLAASSLLSVTEHQDDAGHDITFHAVLLPYDGTTAVECSATLAAAAVTAQLPEGNAALPARLCLTAPSTNTDDKKKLNAGGLRGLVRKLVHKNTRKTCQTTSPPMGAVVANATIPTKEVGELALSVCWTLTFLWPST